MVEVENVHHHLVRSRRLRIGVYGHGFQVVVQRLLPIALFAVCISLDVIELVERQTAWLRYQRIEFRYGFLGIPAKNHLSDVVKLFRTVSHFFSDRKVNAIF